MLEAEAAENSSRPSPRPRTKFWPRGQLVLEYLTSLTDCRDVCRGSNHNKAKAQPLSAVKQSVTVTLYKPVVSCDEMPLGLLTVHTQRSTYTVYCY